MDAPAPDAVATGVSAIMLNPWQFRLTHRPHAGAQPLGRFWLSLGPDLPLTVVTDGAGHEAGVLLGFPIDLDRQCLIGPTWVAPVDADLTSDKGVCRTLLALGGRFVWICLTDTMARIYPDAATQVSVVWDRESQSAGTTAAAILDNAAYAARFDHATFATLRLDGGDWFPAGLTAHSGVSRLLPNHYLDLCDWQAQRFDMMPEVAAAQDPATCVDEVIATVQAQIAALLSGPRQVAFGLTAGHETRTLLACARAATDRITFVTVTGTGRQKTDTLVARRLATAFSLHHRELPRRSADDSAQRIYLRRSGHCVGDTNLRYHPSIAPLAPDHVLVGGVGGEVARAFYHHDSDTPATPLDARGLLARMGLRGNDKMVRHMRFWLDGLAGASVEQVLDLLYLENRLGPWAMAQFCAYPTIPRFAPFVTYRSVCQMRALPWAWKRSNRLNHEIVARLWPELLDHPYNTLGPLRDAAGQVRQLVSDPAILARKIRQRRA